MSMKAIEPTSGCLTEKVKIIVSTIYALTPLGMLIYELSMGSRPNTIILLVALVFMFASGYTLFGERTMEQAKKTAEDVTSAGDEDSK